MTYYDNNKCDQTSPPPPPEPTGDFLSIFIHLLVVSLVRENVSQMIDFLLVFTRQCLALIPDITSLVQITEEIDYYNIADEMLRAARTEYVAIAPPPGFLEDCLLTIIAKPEVSEDSDCFEALKLSCDCDASSDIQCEESVSSLSLDVETPKPSPVSSKVSSEPHVTLDPKPSSLKPIIVPRKPSVATRVDASSPSSGTESESKSSSCASKSTITLFSPDDSINDYFDRYPIDYDKECGKVKLNRTKFLIQESGPLVEDHDENQSPSPKIPEEKGDSACVPICIRVKDKPMPLNSNDIYKVINKETSEEDDQDRDLDCDVIVAAGKRFFHNLKVYLHNFMVLLALLTT